MSAKQSEYTKNPVSQVKEFHIQQENLTFSVPYNMHALE